MTRRSYIATRPKLGWQVKGFWCWHHRGTMYSLCSDQPKTREQHLIAPWMVYKLALEWSKQYQLPFKLLKLVPQSHLIALCPAGPSNFITVSHLQLGQSLDSFSVVSYQHQFWSNPVVPYFSLSPNILKKNVIYGFNGKEVFLHGIEQARLLVLWLAFEASRAM